jgi:hypothetical protein
LSIELSTPDKAGSSEETRDWELRLDEVRRQALARLWETAANLSRRLGHGLTPANGLACRTTLAELDRWPNSRRSTSNF